MAILRSTDGKFYEVADEQLQDKLISGEELKAKLSGAATGQAPEVKKDEEVTAHGYCWRRNCFHNCWSRNCFRNCHRR